MRSEASGFDAIEPGMSAYLVDVSSTIGILGQYFRITLAIVRFVLGSKAHPMIATLNVLVWQSFSI